MGYILTFCRDQKNYDDVTVTVGDNDGVNTIARQVLDSFAAMMASAFFNKDSYYCGFKFFNYFYKQFG